MFLGRPTTIRHLFSSATEADENSSYFRGPLYLRRPAHENNFYFHRPKSGRRKYSDPNPADTLDSNLFCPNSPPLAVARRPPPSPRPLLTPPLATAARRPPPSPRPLLTPPLAATARRPPPSPRPLLGHARPFTALAAAAHRPPPSPRPLLTGSRVVARPFTALAATAHRPPPSPRSLLTSSRVVGTPAHSPPLAAGSLPSAALVAPAPHRLAADTPTRSPPLAAPAPHRLAAGTPTVRRPSPRPLFIAACRTPVPAPHRRTPAVHCPSPRAHRPPPLAVPAPHRSVEFEPAQALTRAVDVLSRSLRYGRLVIKI
jgi:hypothetical protein|eukprot:XP_020397237.1 extensin-like [Zea mays]